MSTSFNMILRCGLLLLFLCFVSCKVYTDDYGSDTSVNVDQIYSFWPSLHNGARVMQQKRAAQTQGTIIGQSDGGTVIDNSNKEVNVNGTENPIAPQSRQQPVLPNQQDTHLPQTYVPINPGVSVAKEKTSPSLPNKPGDSAPNEETALSIFNKPEVSLRKEETPKAVENPKNNDTHVNQESKASKNQTTVTVSDKTTNGTLEAIPSPLDLNNPGVMKRGIIVFGGFLLLAVAYFIFYRRKSNKNDAGNLESSAKANQFRYGVLQSEDQRDNMELSRIPLTMESDEEDDDLEIFDLEQKKRSLSYINLETNDEDIVFSNSREGKSDTGNLLLDIEDGPSDTLINWSNNGNKSIL